MTDSIDRPKAEAAGWSVRGQPAAAHPTLDAARTALERVAHEASLQSAMAQVFVTHTDDSMFDHVLNLVAQAVDSPIGAFGYIDDEGWMVVPSLKGEVWDRCAMAEKTYRFELRAQGTTEEEAIAQQRTICRNERREVPPGHVPIERVVAAPILHGGRAIGHFAVANKACDYTADDCALLERLVAYVAPMLHSRLREQRLTAEKDHALADLRELAEIVDRSPAVAVVWSAEEGYPVTFVSANIRLFGREPQDLLSGRLRYTDIVHPDDRERMTREIDEHLAAGHDRYAQQYRLVGSDGAVRWIDDRTWVRRDAQGALASFLGIILDVTDRRAAEEELRALSLRDELTGLHNRRSFMNLADLQLRVVRREGRNAALVYLDIDGMKSLNDTYGHREGDTALREVANLLCDVFRDSDVIARLGGDEFAVFMTGVDPEGAACALDRLEGALDDRRTSARTGFFHVSYGVAVCDPASPREIADLLQEADQRMYEHKRMRRRWRAGERSAGEHRQRSSGHRPPGEPSGDQPSGGPSGDHPSGGPSDDRR